MFGLKKLDCYIMKKFLPLFVAAFFICLFVFMMQFTWRYMDDLIGKGLSLDVLAQFFWYMGITMVPMSLPLAVLLASLITFGNMGEQLELLSMKAAGVPLVRIMRPIFVLVAGLTVLSFYFQNVTAPRAQVSMRTLLISMKQAQPAVEIPVGVFYNNIPNLNLYVQDKEVKTGMLYQVIIYKTDQGFDRAQIVLADSGRLEMTADKLHMTLDLWHGEQFENLQQQNISALNSASVPYDRETFAYKRFIIDFDSNFALMDQTLLSDMAQAKNMRQIEHSVDSINGQLDSIGHIYFIQANERWYAGPQMNKADSQRIKTVRPVPFDAILARTSPEQLQTARQNMVRDFRSARVDLEWKSVTTDSNENMVRRHWVEWHQKMTLSLACLFFFFIGAPLGAIIRKGGLGLPAVISVLIFIFYYIINTSGMKMARDGSWNMVFGMWISSAVLIPFGLFLTYKANRDSVVFNAELYVSVLFRLLGLRDVRHIAMKEVVIDPPDYGRMAGEVAALRADCADYSSRNRLIIAPNYFRTFFTRVRDSHVEAIDKRMEAIVEELSNSRDRQVIALLNELPIIFIYAHTSPFTRRRANMVCGIIFPIGLLLWLRIWRFRLRLARDMRQIVKVCDALGRAIARIQNPDGAGPMAVSETDDHVPHHNPTRSGPRRRWSKWGRLLLCLTIVAVAFLAGWYAYRYNRMRQHRRQVPVHTENKENETDAAVDRLMDTKAERAAAPFK